MKFIAAIIPLFLANMCAAQYTDYLQHSTDAGPPPSSVINYSPAGGSYSTAQTVTITTTLSGGTIFYTTDGTTPTIASTRYTGPITVSSTQTVKAIAAVIAIDAQDQNQNTNIGTGTMHWKVWCTQPSCNPGGSGVPQVTTQTFGITSPEHASDGTSMLLSIKSSATVHQTNALMTNHSGTCTSSTCTQFLHDFQVYYDPTTFTNLSQSEHDQYWFDDPDNIRYMYGMQWNKSSGNWQFGGNSNVPWTNSGVTTALTSGAWHHIQLLTHRVPSELTSTPCVDSAGSWPYLYYDQLNLDSTVHAVTKKYCANQDPSGFTGAGMQHQINIFNLNVTETEYYSADNYLVTGDPTVVVPADYTIGSGYPVTIPGTAVAFTNLERVSGWTKDASSSIAPNPPAVYTITQSGTPVIMTLSTTGVSGKYTGWMAKKGITTSSQVNMVLRATYTFDSVSGIQAWEVGRRATNASHVTDNGQTQLVPITGGVLEFDIVPSSSGGWADTGCRFPTFVIGTTYTEELYYINDTNGALSLMYVSLNGTICTIPSGMQHVAGSIMSPPWSANAAAMAFQPDANKTAVPFNATVTMSAWVW